MVLPTNDAFIATVLAVLNTISPNDASHTTAENTSRTGHNAGDFGYTRGKFSATESELVHEAIRSYQTVWQSQSLCLK